MTEIDNTVRRWCIDPPETRVHEQAVGLAETELGLTVQYALPSMGRIASLGVSADVLRDIVHKTGLLSGKSNSLFATGLGFRDTMVEQFDLVHKPCETTTLEFSLYLDKFGVSEDVTTGVPIGIGDEVNFLWPEGVEAINKMARARKVYASRRIPADQQGTKINQLLSRMSAMHVGQFALNHGMPAIFTNYSKERNGFIFTDTKSQRNSQHSFSLAKVSAPLRNLADLVNLANFSATIFDDEIPYNEACVKSLLKGRWYMPHDPSLYVFS